MSVFNTSSNCVHCEKYCIKYASGEGNPIFGTTAASIFLFIYSCLSIWILWRLAVLRLSSKQWNLKEIIFVMVFSGTTFRVVRYFFLIYVTLRYILVLSAKLSKATYLIDSLLYWEGFALLFIAYFLLLAFWAAIINKHGASNGWFTSKMKIIVITFIITIAVVLTALPLVDHFTTITLFPTICNAIVVVYLLVLSISSIVKGIQVLRLLEQFSVKDRAIIRVVTILTTLASTSMALW